MGGTIQVVCQSKSGVAGSSLRQDTVGRPSRIRTLIASVDGQSPTSPAPGVDSIR